MDKDKYNMMKDSIRGKKVGEMNYEQFQWLIDNKVPVTLITSLGQSSAVGFLTGVDFGVKSKKPYSIDFLAAIFSINDKRRLTDGYFIINGNFLPFTVDSQRLVLNAKFYFLDDYTEDDISGKSYSFGTSDDPSMGKLGHYKLKPLVDYLENGGKINIVT